jgi:hypothetical protein
VRQDKPKPRTRKRWHEQNKHCRREALAGEAYKWRRSGSGKDTHH